MKAIKKNLKDGILDKTWKALMYCRGCGAEYSANSGDYWDTPAEHKFQCCGKTMDLVTKKTLYCDLQ